MTEKDCSERLTILSLLKKRAPQHILEAQEIFQAGIKNG